MGHRSRGVDTKAPAEQHISQMQGATWSPVPSRSGRQHHVGPEGFGQVSGQSRLTHRANNFTVDDAKHAGGGDREIARRGVRRVRTHHIVDEPSILDLLDQGFWIRTCGGRGEHKVPCGRARWASNGARSRAGAFSMFDLPVCNGLGRTAYGPIRSNKAASINDGSG